MTTTAGQQKLWYDRCGLASLEDLESPHLKEVLARLERAQGDFLSREEQFRSPDYPWPRDALHQWSRVWEYPYVLSNLLRLRPPVNGSGQCSRVLDFGSGVSFFPFALAHQGYRVVAFDVDPCVRRDFTKAMQAMALDRDQMKFVLGEGKSLSFADCSFDFIYSISVLEHIPKPETLVSDLARVLTPGGVLLLTIDICLQGAWEMTASSYRKLRRSLLEHFEFALPEETIHPASTLTFENSPYPYSRGFSFSRRAFRRCRNILHAACSLAGMPTDCTVMGMVLRKKPRAESAKPVEDRQQAKGTQSYG